MVKAIGREEGLKGAVRCLTPLSSRCVPSVAHETRHASRLAVAHHDRAPRRGRRLERARRVDALPGGVAGESHLDRSATRYQGESVKADFVAGRRGREGRRACVFLLRTSCSACFPDCTPRATEVRSWVYERLYGCLSGRLNRENRRQTLTQLESGLNVCEGNSRASSTATRSSLARSSSLSPLTGSTGVAPDRLGECQRRLETRPRFWALTFCAHLVRRVASPPSQAPFPFRPLSLSLATPSRTRHVGHCCY